MQTCVATNNLVGLPDTVVQEARERVRVAVYLHTADAAEAALADGIEALPTSNLPGLISRLKQSSGGCFLVGSSGQPTHPMPWQATVSE